jgi:hypothetical protein
MGGDDDEILIANLEIWNRMGQERRRSALNPGESA